MQITHLLPHPSMQLLEAGSPSTAPAAGSEGPCLPCKSTETEVSMEG